MATTLDDYLPYDSGPGANAQEEQWRMMARHWMGSASGVIRGQGDNFQTYGDSTGMQVKIKTGACWLDGHFGSHMSGEITQSIAAAHATLARRDAVVLRNDFTNNRIEVDVKTGTPAGTPTLPSVTQNTSMFESYLADVTVPAAAATITAGNVVDKRFYTTVFSKYIRTTTATLANNVITDLHYTNATTLDGNVTPNSTSDPFLFTLGRSGLWVVNAQTEFASNSSNARFIQIINSAETNTYGHQQVAPSANANTGLQCQATEHFPAGTILKVRVRQTSGGNLDLAANLSTVSFMWVGP